MLRIYRRLPLSQCNCWNCSRKVSKFTNSENH